MSHHQITPGDERQCVSRTRAVVYARSARTDSPTSVMDHSREAREYADHHNLEMVRVYTDIGMSGARIEDGSQLKQLLRDAGSARRDFSVIIIQEWSRLGRGIDAMNAYLAFFRAGVDIRVCREPANVGQSTSRAIQRACEQYCNTMMYPEE